MSTDGAGQAMAGHNKGAGLGEDAAHDENLADLVMESLQTRRRRFGAFLPWLGGGREEVLRFCPGERSLFGGLGLGVLLTAVFGGASATLAIGYMLRVPVTQAWPAGVLWGLVIGNIDRLLLLVTSGRRRLLAMLPRLAISVFLGVLIAEPLTLRIFQPEITAQVVADQQHQETDQLATIEKSYQPRISADNGRITVLDDQMAALQANQNRMLLLAGCEATQASCSTTHRLGCGPYCQYYQRQAVALERRYQMIAQQDRTQIVALRADAATLTTQQAAAEQNAHATIAASGGWLARKAALDQLQRADPGVRDTVWLVRCAFVLIDLAPMVIKFLLVLFGKSVYEEIAVAAAGRERVAAHRLLELARVERRKITRRADAADEIDEAELDSWKESKITATYGRHWGPTADRSSPNQGEPQPTEAQVRGLTLADFAEGSQAHERMPVPIAPPLARLAWIGTSLLAGLAVAIAVSYHVHAPLAGSWAAPTVLPAGALAAWSRGYRIAPAWAHRAAFATGLAGLVLPALITALNL